MGDIIHQGGQYSLVNNVRGDNFWGEQYSLLHRFARSQLLICSLNVNHEATNWQRAELTMLLTLSR